MPASPTLKLQTPPARDHQAYTDAAPAVARLEELYREACDFLAENFAAVLAGGRPAARYRAFYPEIRITTTSHAQTDSRLSFGHVARPGTYATTITRPDLFRNYLEQQIGLLIENHQVPVLIIHFCNSCFEIISPIN